jgi:hypothetical protein
VHTTCTIIPLCGREVGQVCEMACPCKCSRACYGAGAGRAIPSINEWVELSRQLQQRRAQLAASSGAGSSMSPPALNGSAASAAAGGGGGHPAAPAPLPAPAAEASVTDTSGHQQQQQQHAAQQAARVPGKMTAGAARPHGGVRHTALGSVLRRLRAEDTATNAAAAVQK